MIICPNCQHKELPGTLFCSECGAQLAFTEKLSTQSIRKIEEETNYAGVKREAEGSTSTLRRGVESQISLLLVDTGKVVPLIGRKEFTIGRVTEGQPILPDIDLNSFRGLFSRCIPIACFIKNY